MIYSNTPVVPLLTKEREIKEYSEWFESQRNIWDIFAITAVFNASGYRPNATRWLDEYKHKVLWKINKLFSRRGNQQLPFDDVAQYEFGESSLFKTAHDRSQVHHVHGIVPVPKQWTPKIWNFETSLLNPRLIKDFKSIKTVSSVLMEPMREGETINWITYMCKGKSSLSA